MFFYGKKCCNGVRWKQSIQNYERHLFSGTAQRRLEVMQKSWKPKPSVHFTLCERGKVRPIDAPYITDRQIHKVLSKEVLVPLYEPSMICDNGASRTGKGLHWQYKRIKQQLARHYRKYGREGGVLLLDLKKFFPYAPRNLIFQRHRQLILNDDLRWLADAVIQSAPETIPGRGMPLGVEPSQQEMVALRNPHNFFYSAMGNIYSHFFRKKSEEEQLFEKLEIALNLGNLRSIRFRSQLFHHCLKSK